MRTKLSSVETANGVAHVGDLVVYEYHTTVLHVRLAADRVAAMYLAGNDRYVSLAGGGYHPALRCYRVTEGEPDLGSTQEFRDPSDCPCRVHRQWPEAPAWRRAQAG